MNKRNYLSRFCPAVDEWRELLDRNLPTPRASEMETHLDGCPACLSLVESLMPPLPRGVAGLMREFDRPLQPSDERWRRWAGTRPGSDVAPEPSGVVKLPFEKRGQFESRGRIGRGGMGEVYRAWEIALQRDVAIKILPMRAPASSEAIARLREEAQRLARLEHPNIVRIYSVGEDDGVPYFTMELVAGPTPTLAAWLRKGLPTARRAAEIVKLIAEAVHHAHASGVFHLDLKPANILLSVDGVPKVGDFGLSRTLDVDPARPRGRAAGTDEYMAPEQWVGDPSALREPSDIYGIGAVLHELLTGSPPFARSAERAETRRRVLFDEPILAEGRHAGVPADLRKICLRCLKKRPEARYATAGEVAEALGRFLDGFPIEDCSWARRGLYLVRRHRTAFGVACAASLLAVGVLATLSQAAQQQKQIDASRSGYERGRKWTAEGRVFDGFRLMRESRDQLPSGERLWRDHYTRNIAAWEAQLPEEVAMYKHPSRVMAAVVSPDDRMILIGDETGATTLWDRTTQTSRVLRNLGSPWAVTVVAFNSSAKLCASGGRDSMVTVWDVATGAIVTQCRLNYFLRCLAFLEDGTSFVTGTADSEALLRRWRIAPGQAIELPMKGSYPRTDFPDELVVSPRGDRLVSTTASGRSLLWDASTGNLVTTLGGDKVSGSVTDPVRAAFANDGSLAVIAGPTLTIHEDRTGKTLRSVDVGRWKQMYAAGFREDGGLNLVLDTGRSTVVRRGTPGMEAWDDSPIDKLDHESGIATITRRGDIFVGTMSKTLRLLKPQALHLTHTYLGEDHIGLARIHSNGDGSRFVTLTKPEWIPRWLVERPDPSILPSLSRSRIQIWNGRSMQALSNPVDLTEGRSSVTVALSPTDGTFAVGCLGSVEDAGRARILVGEINEDKNLRFTVLGWHESSILDLTYTVDGRAILASSTRTQDGHPAELICWSLATSNVLWKIPQASEVVALATSPDGTVIATGGSDGSIRIQSLSQPNQLAFSLDTGGRIDGLTFSGDSRHLAVALRSGQVFVFGVMEGIATKEAQLDQIGTSVSTLHFSPDSGDLYIKCSNGINRWDTRTWEPIEPSIDFAVNLLDFCLIPGSGDLVGITRNGQMTRKKSEQ